MNGGGGLKCQCLSMMAIDVRRVQLDSRQKYDATIDLSLPSTRKIFLLQLIFRSAFSRVVLWRRLARKQSHDLAEFIEDHSEYLQHFYCLLFFGEIIHRFPGVYLSEEIIETFFPDHAIYHLRCGSPCSQ